MKLIKNYCTGFYLGLLVLTVADWIIGSNVMPYVVALDYIWTQTQKLSAKQIKIKYHSDVVHLEQLPQGDWIDLKTAENITIEKGKTALVSLGISIKLPQGYEAHVLPRSSTFKNHKVLLTNSQGIIDNSYSGNGDIWKLNLLAMEDTTILAGTRIAQFRVVRSQDVELVEVDDLGNNNRGGFGSTGK